MHFGLNFRHRHAELTGNLDKSVYFRIVDYMIRTDQRKQNINGEIFQFRICMKSGIEDSAGFLEVEIIVFACIEFILQSGFKIIGNMSVIYKF